MMNKGIKGIIALIGSALLLGLSFPAQKSASVVIEPFCLNTLRFFIGVITLAIIDVVINNNNNSPVKYNKNDLIKGGILSGITLFMGFSLNQYFISFVDAGKAGFLTSMYIIIVPLICTFSGKKLTKNVKIGLFTAIFGLYLLCGGSGSEKFSINDLGLLASAIFFAFQIIIASIYAPKTDAIKLSCLQFLTAGILSLPLMFLDSGFNIEGVMQAIVPLLFLGIVVTGFAYTMQIYGQKTANPILATMILSCESVFAVIFAFLFLGETLTLKEFWGCAILICAIIISQLPSKPVQHLQRVKVQSDDNVHKAHLY